MLLEEWARWRPLGTLILDGDREALRQARSSRQAVINRSWRAAYRAGDFAAPGDNRLHLGLVPQPFIGDLRRASIFVLLLNPGLSPSDYYGEYQVPSFRRALLANLSGLDRRGNSFPVPQSAICVARRVQVLA